MLVFTVFHEKTESWFAVSSNETVERSWSILLESQAKEHHGPLMDHLIAHGVEDYKLETWGEADSSAEARELLRDAQDELGALVQGMPRKEKPKAAKPKAKANSALALDAFKDMLNEAGKQTEPKKEAPAKKSGSDGGRDEMHQVMVAIEARRLSMKKSAADKRRAEARKTAKAAKAAAKASTAAAASSTATAQARPRAGLSNDPQMDELLARLDARAASVSRR